MSATTLSFLLYVKIQLLWTHSNTKSQIKQNEISWYGGIININFVEGQRVFISDRFYIENYSVIFQLPVILESDWYPEQ